MLMKVSTAPRFTPVEIGNVGGVRAVVEPVHEVMSAHAGMGMMGKIERRIGLV